MGIVYRIYCRLTDKSYIGKTIQELSTRIKQHRHKNSYCRSLNTAIKEHGWNNFEVSTLYNGDNSTLGLIERYYIRLYNTIEPRGYNIREGGGKSERVSETSKQLMTHKQREISKRRHGLLGTIIQNKHSYSLRVCIGGKTHRFGNFTTHEEALKEQIAFALNPDSYTLPSKRRAGNGKSTNCYYDKSRDKWLVMFYINGKNVSFGRYETHEEALKVAREIKISSAENRTQMTRLTAGDNDHYMTED